MNENRVLPLESVHNFRDYGGYTTAAGGRVKSGLLWRSGEHGGATDADLARIGQLGLTTVIDLRGNSERANNPCRRPDDFAAEVVFHDGETAGLALHVEAAEGVLTQADARRAMQRLYEGLPYRENLLPVLRRYFAVLAAREGPSVVHCLAGKDRTGFAVAMLHHALGVSRDDIMADYLLTNVAGNIDRRIAAGGQAIRVRHGGIDEATIRTLMGVEPEYLEASFAAIDQRYPSLDAYLTAVLGVDEALRDRLRARYIET
ncbi:MAG TPA: tyrosine-protein phosphatase [Novosphingobium sp.]|nr:tyrosine-protein phosphatase [Novosphingobium sp.]